MSVDDETLMAFADGVLPADRAAEVERAVAADPALAARAERFRAVGMRLRGALDAIQPPPDMLARAQAAAAANARPRGLPAWPMAVAAGVAGLAVGAVLMSALGDGGALAPGMKAGSALTAALDGTASGGATARGGRTISVLYTVVAADGRACRAFRVDEAAAAFEGAACRDRDGWRVVVLAGAAPRPSGFGQASTGEPAAVAAAVDAVKPGAPLDAAAEAALIERGWRE